MKSFMYVVMGLGILLSSCGTAPREEASLRPVKIKTVESLGVTDKSFSGVVIPDQYSNLAFKVGGPLIKMNVDAGEKVRKNQIIAEIDPIDYRLKYEASRSSFLTAQSQLNRAEKLLAKDAISHQDYESIRANFDNAKAAFENASSMMEETKLRAPFDGYVHEKFVENYQKVQPGMQIIRLINPTSLQVRFTLPEASLALLSEYELFIEFENYKGILFKSKLKEMVPASTDGAGMPVFLQIDDNRFNFTKYNVGVGFICRVILRHGNTVSKASSVVPVAALVADENGKQPHVFVYDEETSSVKMRKVVAEDVVRYGDVVIAEGLQPGEKVVIAGATRLVDGQKVKVLSE